MEEGYLDELAEGKDTNTRVLRAEELDDEGDALGGGDDKGKLGGLEVRRSRWPSWFSSRLGGQYISQRVTRYF